MTLFLYNIVLCKKIMEFKKSMVSLYISFYTFHIVNESLGLHYNSHAWCYNDHAKTCMHMAWTAINNNSYYELILI